MKLAVKHMQFSPSKKARLAAENALIDAALIAFKNKVNIVMRTMDENNYRVLDLDIGHNHNRPIATYQKGRMLFLLICCLSSARTTEIVCSWLLS